VKLLFVKVWYIVIGDDWCSAVPDSWVFKRESTIWWPPKGITITTAISKELQSSDTWTVTPYVKNWLVLLGSYILYFYNSECYIRQCKSSCL